MFSLRLLALAALVAAAMGRLGADTTVNITEYTDAACGAGAVKRVQTFPLDKCSKTINRFATCKGGVANVTWYVGSGCTGAINSTYAYPTATCTKGDKKHSFSAVCY